MIRFGPSGNSDIFYEQGYKSSVDMPAWLSKMGLNAYEYSCSKGVKIGAHLAGQIGENARLHDIFVSIHAPYYINMASDEKEKQQNSIRYVLETLQAARWMGAKRIVVHTGSCSKLGRKQALQNAKAVMKETIREADASGFGDIAICPEVLGKLNQLGSLEEILELCGLDERLIPTIDFGHMHARGMGCLNSTQDFTEILDKVENSLGEYRLKNFHSHFSRIEFTAGGERRHWTQADTQFGPEFKYLAEALLIKQVEPVIICEARGTMAEDAAKMKKIYETLAGGENV